MAWPTGWTASGCETRLWVAGDGNRESADAEVRDLLDRAYETAGLQNVDAMADFFRQANRHLGPSEG